MAGRKKSGASGTSSKKGTSGIVNNSDINDTSDRGGVTNTNSDTSGVGSDFTTRDAHTEIAGMDSSDTSPEDNVVNTSNADIGENRQSSRDRGSNARDNADKLDQ